jgi:hypothetical protein
MVMQNRYREMERYMTYALIGDGLLFIFYLLSAGAGIIWLKVILTILAFALSGVCLTWLYISKELLKPRSMWMSAAALAVIVCILVSLLLNYPSPMPILPIIQ